MRHPLPSLQHKAEKGYGLDEDEKIPLCLINVLITFIFYFASYPIEVLSLQQKELRAENSRVSAY